MLNINLLNKPGKQIDGVEKKIIPVIHDKPINLKLDTESGDEAKNKINPLRTTITITITIILFTFIMLYYYFQYYD